MHLAPTKANGTVRSQKARNKQQSRLILENNSVCLEGHSNARLIGRDKYKRRINRKVGLCSTSAIDACSQLDALSLPHQLSTRSRYCSKEFLRRQQRAPRTQGVCPTESDAYRGSVSIALLLTASACFVPGTIIHRTRLQPTDREPPNMDDAHTKPIEEVIGFFKTDEITGLSDEQVERAQEKYGPNGKCDTKDACILYVTHTVSPGF